MPFAYSKLHGLPADRLLAAIEPILAAHGLEGVELIWKTDNRGWLLYVTVERASEGGPVEPGAGVTLDDCSELSRDLSAALDVDDLIPGAYRLEVGTPGIERRLYTTSDFRRFTSKLAKVKLHKAQAGEYTFRGYIVGVEGEGDSTDAATVVLSRDADASTSPVWRFEFANVSHANLVLEWGGDTKPKGSKAHKAAHPKAAATNESGNKKSDRVAEANARDADVTASGEQNDYSDDSGSDDFGQDAEFDSAATVATTQVKHGS